MAYDESLARRIRDLLREHHGITERRMFGGIAFMLDGHMLVGVADESLMARVGPGDYERALGTVHVRKMDFTGRPMRGYVFVDPAGLKTDEQLAHWVRRCETYVRTLAAKRPAKNE